MRKIYVVIVAIVVLSYIFFISHKTNKHYQHHIDFITKEIAGVQVLEPINKLLLDTLNNTLSPQLFQKETTKLQTLFQNNNFFESLTTLKEIKNLYEEETIFNHDLLIQKETSLFKGVANDSNLILDPDLNTYYLMDYLINSYPISVISLANLKQTITNNLTDEDKIAAIVEFINTNEELQETLYYILKYNPELSKQISHRIRLLQETIKILTDKLQNTPKITPHTKKLFHLAENLTIKIFHCSKERLLKLLEEKKTFYQEQQQNGIISLLIFSVIIILITILIFSYDKIAQKNQYLAYHDQLTGVLNIHALQNDLNRSSPKGMLLVDIKKFSNINDFYGEIIGDIILQKFAKILQTFTKEYHCNLYRVSADQFVLLSYDQTENLCQKIAKKIFKKFLSPLDINHQKKLFSINIKVRIAKICAHLVDVEANTWKIKADMALNYAKKKNKDYITYDQDLGLEETIQNEMALVAMVQTAILENRVVPVFQKIQKTDNSSYETLMRIKEKNSNILIPPVAFLDAVKNTPYYEQLTKIMIKKAFDYFSNRDEMFSINFSFSDITNKSTINYFIKMVHNYNMHGRVIVELLEDESIKNIEIIKQFIKKMRSFNIQIAIDDFGSGYSNFIYLTQIQPDYIKIDGSLIKHIDTDKKSYITVKHIHNFAKEIGCKTIAEFVSSKEIAQIVKEIGIDGMQGFYIAKPSETI